MSNEFAKPRPRWRDGLVNPRPVPDDFEATFLEIGRLECETHYHVGRFVIDFWLEQSGKQRLIEARAEVVRKRQEAEREIERRRQMAKILSRSFPVEDARIVSHEVAAAAAHHLRIGRNGGLYVSPTGDGDWWVGLRRRSSAELVDMAKARGFDPASLTGRGSTGIGSGQ